MRHTTKIEDKQNGLTLIHEAAVLFCQGRYLNALCNCNITKREVILLTEEVRENKCRLNREYFSLAWLAEEFNKKYATNANEQFSLADKLCRRIRSTIALSKQIYKKFCVRVKDRRGMRTQGSQLVFSRSQLRSDYYSGMLFGMETYDECVQELYVELEEFFMKLIQCLLLCHMVIKQEQDIRRSPDRCGEIFQECYQQVLANSRLMLQLLRKQQVCPSSPLQQEWEESKSADDFICKYFHMLNESEFQEFVIERELCKDNGLTNEEKILFGPHSTIMATRMRIAIMHFDELEENAHKGKHKDKHSALCVASLMLWGGIGQGQDDKVRIFVEEYFNKVYRGKYPPISISSVNGAKNTLLHNSERSHLNHEAFMQKIDALVKKYQSAA